MKIYQVRIGLHNFDKPKRGDVFKGLEGVHKPVAFVKDENNYFAEVIESKGKYYYRVDGVVVAMEENEPERVLANPLLYYFSTALKLHIRIKRAIKGEVPQVILEA